MKSEKGGRGWLSQQQNQQVIAWIAVGLIAMAGSLWAAFGHFSAKEKSTLPTTPPTTASSSGSPETGQANPTASSAESIVNTVENSTAGITLEQFKTDLKQKEQAICSELSKTSAAHKEKDELLEIQLANIQNTLKNPLSAFADYKNRLNEAFKVLDDLKNEVSPEQIQQAQVALMKGQTGEAEQAFYLVLTQGKGNAAKVAYQLGQLSYGRIDYTSADRYYRQAKQLQPDNPLFLNASASMAEALGHYPEAEPLYQQALMIREKNLGPDHPDVAVSLNNLAKLYRMKGAFAKAEPFYQRVIAIGRRTWAPIIPT